LRFGCATDIDLSEQAACAPCGGAGLLANHIDLDMVEIDRVGIVREEWRTGDRCCACGGDHEHGDGAHAGARHS